MNVVILIMNIITCILVICNYFVNKQITKSAEQMRDEAFRILKETEKLENKRKQ